MAEKTVKNPNEAQGRFYLGGGLLIEAEDAHLTNISLAGSAPLSFGSLLCDFKDVFSTCTSTFYPSQARSNHQLFLPMTSERFLRIDKLWDASFDNYQLNEPVFLRTIRARTPFCLRFFLPPYCTAVYYPRYPLKKRFVKAILLRAKAGAPAMNGTFTDREHRMLVLLAGEITCDAFGMSLQVQPGNSGVAFLRMDEKEDEKYAEQAFIAICGGMLEDMTLAKTDRYGMDRRLLSENQVPCFSHSDRRMSPEALPAFVKLAKRTGNDEKAFKALSEFARLIVSERAVFSAYPHFEVAPDPAAAAAFLYAAALYADEKPLWNTQIQSLWQALKIALYQANAAAAGGMLPMISENTFIRSGKLTEDIRFCGCAEASADYIDGASWLLTSVESGGLRLPRDSGRTRQLISEAADRFERNFFGRCEPSLICRDREKLVRRPPEVFGFCDFCMKNNAQVSRERLTRARGGCYLCASCLALYQNEKRIIEDDCVFGAYAVSRAVQSKILREKIGSERLQGLLKMYSGARAEKSRSAVENAGMLEAALFYGMKNVSARLAGALSRGVDPYDTRTIFSANAALVLAKEQTK